MDLDFIKFPYGVLVVFQSWKYGGRIDIFRLRHVVDKVEGVLPGDVSGDKYTFCIAYTGGYFSRERICRLSKRRSALDDRPDGAFLHLLYTWVADALLVSGDGMRGDGVA